MGEVLLILLLLALILALPFTLLGFALVFGVVRLTPDDSHGQN